MYSHSIVVCTNAAIPVRAASHAGPPPIPRADSTAASMPANPRSVHGQGESHGFVPMLATIARDKGFPAWVGDGTNLWPAVHRLNCAHVYMLALERGARGEAYRVIAERGVPFRTIAEAIGRQLGLPSRSVAADEADRHFGAVAMFAAGNGPASSERTRAALGWQPYEQGFIVDIERPDYSA